MIDSINKIISLPEPADMPKGREGLALLADLLDEESRWTCKAMVWDFGIVLEQKDKLSCGHVGCAIGLYHRLWLGIDLNRNRYPHSPVSTIANAFDIEYGKAYEVFHNDSLYDVVEWSDVTPTMVAARIRSELL